jgi:hypothetical protein
VVQNPSTGETTPFEVFWSDICVPLIDTFGNACKDVGNALFAIFDSNDSISPEQALAKLGNDPLLDFLNGIKKLASGFVKLGASLVRDIKAALNYKITIPVFSWLYKTFFSGGSDLTVLDGLALILAIPTTIVYKLIKDTTPPDMTTLNYLNLLNTNQSQDTVLAFNTFCNATVLCCRPIMAAIEVVQGIFGFSSRYEVGKAKQLRRLPRQYPISKQPKAAADLAKKYWQDVFAIVITAATIPLDTELPAYDLRWGSWAVCALNRGTSMAIRRVNSATSKLISKGLGVKKIILGAVNYGLVIAIKVEEFQNDFPGKVEAFVVLDCSAATFDLVGSTCEGAAVIDPGKDPRLFSNI